MVAKSLETVPCFIVIYYLPTYVRLIEVCTDDDEYYQQEKGEEKLNRHFSCVSFCMFLIQISDSVHIICTYYRNTVYGSTPSLRGRPPQSTYLYRVVQGKFDDDSAPTFLMHGNCRENKIPLPTPCLLQSTYAFLRYYWGGGKETVYTRRETGGLSG